ncbi:MAG: site-specific integrase [Lachnospiraceae bacterium]|nr:site-specific integrase [Lachnospiraceae bacterium]
MKAEKDPKTGKWLVQYRYTDYRGQRKKSTKRGFRTKKEAEEWLRDFLAMKQSSLSMTFSSFLELYYADMGKRLRENTMRTKKYIMDIKILPYFGEKSMCDIRATDIRAWQNELMEQEFAPTYLKTIQNQLSAVFNYAVRYYDLPSNPCLKAGSMGKSRAEEMDFWTKDEFMRFSDSVMEKHMSYMAFTTLYWTGMRLGELLALTWRDIDLEMKTISINKSYQRIGKRDVITPPKTPKGKRVIRIPEFLAVDLRDFQDSFYDVKEDDRVFPITKYYLEHEIERGVKKSGVKRLNIHSLRHAHASLLIELGFSPLEIAERLGHEKIETTLNTYSHLYPKKQDQLADRLDKEYQEGLK